MITDSQRYYAEETAYARLEWAHVPCNMPYDKPWLRWPSRREVVLSGMLLSPLLEWPWAWQMWRSLLIWTGQVPPVADGTGTAPTLLSDSTAGIADQLGLFIDICAAVAILAVGMYLLHKIAAGLRRVVG